MKVKGCPPKPVWVSSSLVYPSHLAHNPDYILCYPRYCTISGADVDTVRGEGLLSCNGKVRDSMDEGLGGEFSGFDHYGKMVMGIVPNKVMG